MTFPQESHAKGGRMNIQIRVVTSLAKTMLQETKVVETTSCELSIKNEK